MTVMYEARHPVAFILMLANGYRSIEAVKIPQNQTIVPGQILGARAVVADVTSLASVGTNTGNATIAMGTPALTSTAKNGRYKGTAVTATTVHWEDPDGNEIGTSTHGSLFTKGGLRLTITAGGTPNVAGDEFFVLVGAEPADYEWVPFTTAAVDGTEVAAAIAMYGAVTGAGVTTKISAVVRAAEVNAKELVLPEGLTAAQIAKVYTDLAKTGIIVRN